MKEITDPQLIASCKSRIRLDTILEHTDLPFRLYQYEKGELLNHIHESASYLKFVVSGSIRIYALNPDGDKYPIGTSQGFILLGDMEFCRETSLPLIIEALTRILCLELPLAACRKLLMDDRLFLRFVMESLAHKLAQFAISVAGPASLDERLLHYIRYQCPNRAFSGVEEMAFRLRCSRRQLQRVLKALTENGQLIRVRKGTYCLAE